MVRGRNPSYLGSKLKVMNSPGKVFGRFESALDERLVDDRLGRAVRQFTFCHAFTRRRKGSEFRCVRSPGAPKTCQPARAAKHLKFPTAMDTLESPEVK